MILPDGTVIAQDYDGLAGERSDAAALYCDPDAVVYVVSEDGEDVLPLSDRGIPVELYPGRSKTVQATLSETDINLIVERATRGLIPPLSTREGAYLDVSEVPDFQGACEQVRKASEYFALLPAKSRAIFANSPAQFLDAVKDASQLQKLIDAGVIPEDEVIVPEVVPPPAVS